MSIKIRTIALLAISASACFSAVKSFDAPLAIYYSFDTPPPTTVITEMQSEMDRILAPSNLTVTWRSLDDPRDGAEDFPGIVVFRFRGNCSLKSSTAIDKSAPDPAGMPLANTLVADGRVLPFGTVECDTLRRFIARTASAAGSDRDAVLGRAAARVSAHEIFHMLTQSTTHASVGIACASHSREELTASTFSFAKPETDWLRAWALARR